VLITPNPDMMSKAHSIRRSHRVQIMQVGSGKKAHCLDCGARWFNVVAAAEAAVNATCDDALFEEDR